MKGRLSTLCLTLFLSLFAPLALGQWAQLTNAATVSGATIRPSTMLLLTDGTVMCQDSNGNQWYRLTPDVFGNYANGTWTAMPSMNVSRLYYASSLFADGRVIVAGAEYRGGNTIVQDNTYEIFDPVANSWSSAVAVPGMTQVGDAPCSILADGRFLLGQAGGGRNTVIYDPVTGTWTSPVLKLDAGSEESWVLLPDDTVLAPQCQNAPGAEKYLPWSNSWIAAGTVTPNIVEFTSNEIGSVILLPPGNAFGDVLAIGANGNTSFYNIPGNPEDPGTWSAGPTLPLDGSNQTLGCKDTPGILLPNGNILFSVGPVDGVGGNFLGPTSFLLWDYYTNAISFVANPGGAFDATKPPYTGRMLLLPTGQVLFTQEQGNGAVYIYTPPAGFDNAWRPIVDDYPDRVIPGRSYQITGRQLNGMAQASGYGDDAWAPTNYPIVRIRNNATGHVRYCRTHDHSSMGVATGNTEVWTTVDIPGDIEGGASTIEVVANGIPSVALPITIEYFEPITTASLTGTLGNNGWYVSDVTVNFTVDAFVNLGIVTHFRVDGGPDQTGSSVVISADGNPHTVEFWSVNGLFEETPHSFINFKRDATKPTLTFDPQSPAQNALGWNNSTVTISYTASDNLSGVASASPASPITFSGEGFHQTETVTVTDNAGNSDSFTTPFVNIDLTDPVTSDSQEGEEGCNGWFKGPVTVTLNATDNLSGVQATRYKIDGGATQAYAGSFVISGDLQHSVEYWSVDNADNEETHQTITIKIDGTAPVLTATPDKTTLWSPNNKFVPVTVTGTMTDNLSGVDPATARYYVVDEYGMVQPAGPITLDGAGNYSFTIMLEASRRGTDKDGRTYTIFVTAMDYACNETTIQVVVTVPHGQNDGLLAARLRSPEAALAFAFM